MSILGDQSSVFVADEWKFGCELNNIELIEIGTESHNSLGADETYHAYLRLVYQKIRKKHPKLEHDVVLSLSGKELNDFAGPLGLVSSLLVFGVMLQLPTSAKCDHPSQIARFRAACNARGEFEKIVSSERVESGIDCSNVTNP